MIPVCLGLAFSWLLPIGFLLIVTCFMVLILSQWCDDD